MEQKYKSFMQVLGLNVCFQSGKALYAKIFVIQEIMVSLCGSLIEKFGRFLHSSIDTHQIEINDYILVGFIVRRYEES